MKIVKDKMQWAKEEKRQKRPTNTSHQKNDWTTETTPQLGMNSGAPEVPASLVIAVGFSCYNVVINNEMSLVIHCLVN